MLPRHLHPRLRTILVAFTIIELLVVIGIVAILIALLLPMLARAQEHARQTKCASNVREVTVAFLMYAGDNREQFPGPSTVRKVKQDWIYWQPGRDLEDGRLVRYLGRVFNEDVLRCPSDTLARTQFNTEFFNKPYLYSYSANQYIVGPWVPPVKLSQIRKPQTIVLIAEESDQTIDDGCWYPGSWFGQPRVLLNRFSTRHGRAKTGVDGVGNAGFVDGHVEAATLAFAHDPAHFLPVYGQIPGNYLVAEDNLPPWPRPDPNPNPGPNPAPDPPRPGGGDPIGGG